METFRTYFYLINKENISTIWNNSVSLRGPGRFSSVSKPTAGSTLSCMTQTWEFYLCCHPSIQVSRRMQCRTPNFFHFYKSDSLLYQHVEISQSSTPSLLWGRSMFWLPCTTVQVPTIDSFHLDVLVCNRGFNSRLSDALNDCDSLYKHSRSLTQI